MSANQAKRTEPPNDPQRNEQLTARRAHYKTRAFRESITDAFHKAKLHALDDQIATEEKSNTANPATATR